MMEWRNWRWPTAGALGLLLAAGAWYQATRFSNALEDNVHQRLRAAGYSHAHVAVAGRDVTVSGVTTPRGKAAILSVVQDTEGVRSVTDNLTLTSTSDADFQLIAGRELVTVRGVMPDHDSVTSLLSMMKRYHGSRFKNELEVDPNAPKPGWLAAAVDAIPTLYGHPGIEFEVRGNRAVLSGDLPDAETRDALVNVLQRGFGGYGVDIEDRVAVIETTESAHLTLTKLGEHVVLAGHLPSERYVTKLVAVAQIVFPGLAVSDRLSAGEDANEPVWLDAVISLMPELANIDRAGIKTDGRVLTLAGQVRTQADKQAVLERAEYVLGDLMPIEDSLTVARTAALSAPPSRDAGEEFVQTEPIPDPVSLEPPSPQPAPPDANPPARTPVDGQLAREIQQLDLSAVQFESGSARLARSGHAALDRLASLLRQNDLGRIEISGHTDSSGTVTYNMKLSEQRAKTVLNYLITQGVAPRRMASVGYGESRPIASNETEAGKSRNRRIEITVLPRAE